MDAPDEMVEAVKAAVLRVLGCEVPCSCIPAYKERGLTDPQCTYCDVLGSEDLIADAVLSVPALAEVIARDAKVREMWPVVDRLEDHWCECPLPPDAGCSRCHDFFHARSTIAALYPEAGK